ncbi:MAG TPA: BTAD domain-containing putative transcriptional regulator [Gaiellaceae bacterium]|nr:BTAD domain-containing putative transcriptional regulator [Gaiellaceae bacterium]
MVRVDSFEICLLGPVRAAREGRELAIGGRHQRRLLALLVLERGRAVSRERLAEELWRGSPPAAFETTLRSYVSRLRGMLGESASLIGGGAAYALEVRPEAVDSVRFERLLQEAHAAFAKGTVIRALERSREALSLWRGAALADVADDESGLLRLEADRLEELRVDALELRFEAELELGSVEGLVDELEALVRAHPYRERFWRMLMLALYRAERQADALSAYHRARSLLVDELGLEPSEELRRLEQAILRQEVPPARPPQLRHNLPSPVTSFVGRASELAEIETLLSEGRLVTLTGMGGVGKTRLALETASRLLPDFAEGVYWCDLSALSEPALVPRAVARLFDVREQSGVSLLDSLGARLRATEVLLLLDNCEHLRQACAELAQTLLTACPQLRLLATSREPLGVAGETDYSVPPLSGPAAERGSDASFASDAVSLFLARARAARPSLVADDAALLAASRICAELDGLPLAIELAAARAKALSFAEIEARLADRFRFLVSWRRLTPARHQTLREAMDWSYHLLAPEEQALLPRLAVLSGGFTLESAAAVCVEGDREHALELISRLVDASLVVPGQQDARVTRYRLLETVRQYARERGEQSAIASTERRLVQYMVDLVERVQPAQLSELQAWVAELEPERENLRAALTYGRNEADPEWLLRLASGVWRFWWVNGDLDEGRGWLETALEDDRGSDPALRAEALEGASGLAWAAGDLDRARRHADAALPLFTAAGDRRGELAAMTVLGHVELASERYARARSLFERCRQLAEQGDSGSALAIANHNLGSVAYGQGHLQRATQLYRQARAFAEVAGDAYGAALSDLHLGLVAVETGRHDEAAAHFRAALPVFRRMSFPQYISQCIGGIAAVVRAREQPQEATRLLAAAGALRDRTGGAPTVAATLWEREQTAARRELGDDSFATAWAEGLDLRDDEALDRAELAVAG